MWHKLPMHSFAKLAAAAFCAAFPLLSAIAADVPLVSRGDTWRYHKGTNAPQSNWNTVADASLNADWASGPGGIGYADGDDATILSDMQNRYVTVYVRRTFNIA